MSLKGGGTVRFSLRGQSKVTVWPIIAIRMREEGRSFSEGHVLLVGNVPQEVIHK